MVEGAALEKRCGQKLPWVRIPPPPLNYVNSLLDCRDFSLFEEIFIRIKKINKEC